MIGWHKRCHPIFLVFMRVFGLFEQNAGNRFTIDVQTANRSKIRRSGAPSDFFQTGSAFLLFFSPAVGTVEVSDSFIDRLTNPPHRQISSLKVQGVLRPFRSVSAWSDASTKQRNRFGIGVPVTDAQVERVLAGKPCSILHCFNGVWQNLINVNYYCNRIQSTRLKILKRGKSHNSTLSFWDLNYGGSYVLTLLFQ